MQGKRENCVNITPDFLKIILILGLPFQLFVTNRKNSENAFPYPYFNSSTLKTEEKTLSSLSSMLHYL